MLPKKIDKYSLLADIKDIFRHFTIDRSESKIVSTAMFNTACYRIYLDDTANNVYGTNDYHIEVYFSKAEASL